jgi:hypothetical protein
MRRSFLILFALSTLSIDSKSQDADTIMHSAISRGDDRLSLLIGYNGIRSHFAEIGIAKNRLDVVGAHPLGSCYYLSSEMKVDGGLIIGPKLGGWFGGGVAMGLSTIFDTDFEEASWRLRPEVGLGLDAFKVVYGYNFVLTNREFKGINSHTFSLVFLLRLRTITKEK